MKPSLAIYMPNRGQIETETVQSLIQLMNVQQAFSDKIEITIHFMTGDSLISRARNECAASFLASSHSTMMFIDSDIVFRPEDVFKLWMYHLDIVGANYPVSRRTLTDEERQAVVMKDDYPDIAEVSRLPTGFMMIRRAAYEAIIHTNNVQPYLYQDQTQRWGFFIPYVSGPNYLSEDFSFVDRARKSGIRAFMDTTIKLGHIGRKNYEK